MSGIATGTALMIAGGVGAAGSIAGAAMGSSAAGNAASEQSNAAKYAADLQYQASQQSLDFQKQQWDTQQQNLAPWLQSGKEGLGQLDYLLGVGPQDGNSGAGGAYGSLTAANPYSTFTAPTGMTEQNDPGYQARLKLGTDAVQRSAAARGNLLTGGTGQALDQYAQDYASNEYGNVYNRAFNTNASNYNAFNQNQTNQYNRLASLAGVGQQTATQLGTLGNQAAGNINNNLMSTAGMMGQDYQNAAAANASGYIGSANAWGGALGGLGGNVSNLMMMRMLTGGGFGGNGGAYESLYKAQNPDRGGISPTYDPSLDGYQFPYA